MQKGGITSDVTKIHPISYGGTVAASLRARMRPIILTTLTTIASVLANKIINVFGLYVPAGVLAYSMTFLMTDAIGEIANMIAGRVKTLVDPELPNLRLGLPEYIGDSSSVAGHHTAVASISLGQVNAQVVVLETGPDEAGLSNGG